MGLNHLAHIIELLQMMPTMRVKTSVTNKDFDEAPHLQGI
jgi:hypothetical protein